MKCLLKYPWVKLPRDRVPNCKGLMGSWMRLAARAAFRKDAGHEDHFTCRPFLYYEGMHNMFGLQRNKTTVGDAGKWCCKTASPQDGRVFSHKAKRNEEPYGHV